MQRLLDEPFVKFIIAVLIIAAVSGMIIVLLPDPPTKTIQTSVGNVELKCLPAYSVRSSPTIEFTLSKVAQQSNILINSGMRVSTQGALVLLGHMYASKYIDHYQERAANEWVSRCAAEGL